MNLELKVFSDIHYPNTDIFAKLTNFTLNKLFTSQQYGYRAKRSTELATLELMDRNLDNMNRNLTPVNVYIDLSKAFDCLDHNILLSKLKLYGLNDNAIRDSRTKTPPDKTPRTKPPGQYPAGQNPPIDKTPRGQNPPGQNPPGQNPPDKTPRA